MRRQDEKPLPFDNPYAAPASMVLGAVDAPQPGMPITRSHAWSSMGFFTVMAGFMLLMVFCSVIGHDQKWFVAGWCSTVTYASMAFGNLVFMFLFVRARPVPVEGGASRTLLNRVIAWERSIHAFGKGFAQAACVVVACLCIDTLTRIIAAVVGILARQVRWLPHPNGLDNDGVLGVVGSVAGLIAVWAFSRMWRNGSINQQMELCSRMAMATVLLSVCSWFCLMRLWPTG